MDIDQAIEALEAHDPDLPDQAKSLPRGFPDAVAEALAELDERARQLAVRCLVAQDAPGAGEVLLDLSDDSDLMIAASAVEGLFKISDPPPVEAILEEAPRRQDDFLRGRLYLLAGRTGDPDDLARLRRATALERSTAAARDAQVAAVRLGGAEERKAFVDRIAQARADEVLDLCEQLAYVGDVALARPLLAWLPQTEPVMRLGPDSKERMARMCDMAVWTALGLGVEIPGAPAELAVFDAKVLESAEAALKALPA